MAANTPIATPHPPANPTATPTAPPKQEHVRVALPGAVRSAGCLTAPAPPGDADIVVGAGTDVRNARLHVPVRLGIGIPAPLVLAFHGMTMDAEAMVELSELDQLSDSQGFYAVYPLAVGDLKKWNAPEDPARADDVQFVSQLLDKLLADHCVDIRRVYAAGFSLGGAMAQLTACRDDRVAAIALVAAVHGAGGTACRPDHPVPLVSFHGVLDPVVPWRGGHVPLPDIDLPDVDPVMPWTVSWAFTNGCSDPPSATEEQISDWVLKFEWQGCHGATIFYRVGDGGHTWPGGGGTTAFGAINMDIDASRLAWDFFLANARPPFPATFINEAFGFQLDAPLDWQLPGDGNDTPLGAKSLRLIFALGRDEILLRAARVRLEAGIGGVRTGSPIFSDITGTTARELADSFVREFEGYRDAGFEREVDGEQLIVLVGSDSSGRALPMMAVFAHGDRAFLLQIEQETGILGAVGGRDTVLREFLSRWSFID